MVTGPAARGMHRPPKHVKKIFNDRITLIKVSGPDVPSMRRFQAMNAVMWPEYMLSVWVPVPQTFSTFISTVSLKLVCCWQLLLHYARWTLHTGSRGCIVHMISCGKLNTGMLWMHIAVASKHLLHYGCNHTYIWPSELRDSVTFLALYSPVQSSKKGCYVGKGRIHKALNTGVSITMIHVVLGKNSVCFNYRLLFFCMFAAWEWAN